MRILITGLTGFVGGHLAQALADTADHELHGICRSIGRAGSYPNDARLHSIDLSSGRTDLTLLLRTMAPDQVYHLAGYANTGASFREPDAAWQGNLDATRNLYEALEKSGVRPRVLYVSTGLVYGDAPTPGGLLHEELPLRPTSPYAASKAAADLLSYQIARTTGLPIVRVRPFNQIGPRQSADYAVANFARQIAAIEMGRQAPILETGDLSAYRDLTDVRDIVRAYVRLCAEGRPGEVYNAGSGRAVRIRDVLDCLLSLTRVRIEIRERVGERAGDTVISRADIRKIQQQIGWQPELSLERSLADVLEYWRGVTARMREGA